MRHAYNGTTGIRISGDGALVDRTRITGAGAGITICGFDAGDLRSVIVGRGMGPRSVGIGFSRNALQQVADAAVRSNDISATSVGIDLYAFDGSLVGNNVHHNAAGVVMGDFTGVEVRSNLIRDNAGDGIRSTGVTSVGLGQGGTIRSNQVRDNGNDGIALYGCSSLGGSSCVGMSDYRVEGNTSLGNGHFDCFEDGLGTNTWINNIGLTDSNVCTAPH